MKKTKICLNKTITYLFLMILIVFSFLYAVNRINEEKVSKQTQAAGLRPLREKLVITPEKQKKPTPINRLRPTARPSPTRKPTPTLTVQQEFANFARDYCDEVGEQERIRLGMKSVYFTNYKYFNESEGVPTGYYYECVKLNGKVSYSTPDCSTKWCIRCSNKLMEGSDIAYCTEAAGVVNQVFCPSKTNEDNISEIVHNINNNNEVRKELKSYYVLQDTRGHCLLKEGELYNYRTFKPPNNNVKVDGYCVKKVVNISYCWCAGLGLEENVYPETSCNNVIGWINSGDFTHPE